jgi:acyl-CoA synthetase (NDP forming)
MRLDNFFNPRTIAIIGASNHIEKVGGILMKKALASKCKIIPINPSHSEVFGVKCYNSIEDYRGGKIDLAVIAIPKEFVVESLEDCGERGIKNVIVISAGFEEVGDKKDSEKILEIAKKYGIRILGPNCFGIFNSALGLDLTFAKTTPSNGKNVFISQSGALWSYLADLNLNSDKGFLGFVSLGNMVDLSFDEWIEYFSDKNVENIILYVEKVKNGKKFIEVCKKAIAKGKKIYAVKSGSSKEGERAAFSHTASLASDYEIYKGVFNQAGVKLIGLEEAVGLRTSKKKLNITGKIEIITNAGGAGALLSDYLAENGIKSNVRDILGTALAEDYKRALEETKENNIIVILTSQSMTQVEETAKIVVDFKKSSGKKVLVYFLGEKSVKSSNRIFEEAGVEYYNSLS